MPAGRIRLHEPGNVEGDRRYPGGRRFSLETVGVSLALVRSFVWSYTKVLLVFDLNSIVDHDADRLSTYGRPTWELNLQRRVSPITHKT